MVVLIFSCVCGCVGGFRCLVCGVLGYFWFVDSYFGCSFVVWLGRFCWCGLFGGWGLFFMVCSSLFVLFGGVWRFVLALVGTVTHFVSSVFFSCFFVGLFLWPSCVRGFCWFVWLFWCSCLSCGVCLVVVVFLGCSISFFWVFAGVGVCFLCCIFFGL